MEVEPQLAAEVQEAMANNARIFMEWGPCLSRDYRILLGGLGAMGCGQMWFTEDEGHRAYPGYAEAEIVE